MEKNGIVIRVEGDIAHVSVVRPSECGDKCNSCAGSCDTNMMVVEVKNRFDARVGDQVELQMMNGQLIKMSFMLYTVPLAAFIAGIFIGYSQPGFLGINQPDVVAISTGAVFLVGSYWLVNQWLKRSSAKGETILTMSRCYHQSDLLTH